MWLSLGTLLWSVRLCSQSSISRVNGNWLSQIEKHVVVSASSVTSGRGCGGKVICHKKVQQSFLNQNLDPQWKIPGSSPAKMLLWVRSQSRLMLARASKSFFFELRGSFTCRTKNSIILFDLFIYVIWKLCLVMWILEEQETFDASLYNHSVSCGSVVPCVETSQWTSVRFRISKKIWISWKGKIEGSDRRKEERKPVQRKLRKYMI